MKYSFLLSWLFTTSLLASENFDLDNATKTKLLFSDLKNLEKKIKKLQNRNTVLRKKIAKPVNSEGYYSKTGKTIGNKKRPQKVELLNQLEPDISYIPSPENLLKLYKQDEGSILYTLFYYLQKFQDPTDLQNKFFDIRSPKFIKNFRREIIETYKEEYGAQILQETPDIEKGTKEFDDAILERYLSEKNVLKMISLHVMTDRIKNYYLENSEFLNESIIPLFDETLKDYPYKENNFSRKNILEWIDSSIKSMEGSFLENSVDQCGFITKTQFNFESLKKGAKLKGNPEEIDSLNSYKYANPYEGALISDSLMVLTLLKIYGPVIEFEKETNCSTTNALSPSFKSDKEEKPSNIDLEDIPAHPHAFDIAEQLFKKLESMVAFYVIKKTTLPQNDKEGSLK